MSHWKRSRGKQAQASASKDHIAGRPIIGEHYRPSCGNCGLPPWEACACSSLLANNGGDERTLQLLLRELEKSGIGLFLEGDLVVASPTEKISPPLWAMVQEHVTELREWLQQQERCWRWSVSYPGKKPITARYLCELTRAVVEAQYPGALVSALPGEDDVPTEEQAAELRALISNVPGIEGQEELVLAMSLRHPKLALERWRLVVGVPPSQLRH